MELVTIQTFDNSFEAHLLKSRLESEDIVCFLFDENIVSLNPLYDLPIGGIKLKVDRTSLDQASKIVDEYNNSAPINDDGKVIKCPNCGSEDIYSGFRSMRGAKGILSVIISFLFFVFPIYFKTLYRCKSCEHEFKNS